MSINISACTKFYFSKELQLLANHSVIKYRLKVKVEKSINNVQFLHGNVSVHITVSSSTLRVQVLYFSP